MSAGTAYSKRYGAGFVNLPTQTTAIDSQFLNAVEAALLQLIGSAPTADGQVAQWDFANTRFGPALLLNKNIDPAAAIDKSKLNLTGQIVDADVSGSAAISRSKLNFGSGLVNADIAAAAAIAANKLAIASANTSVTISASNTDLAAPTGVVNYMAIGTGGGTLRSIGVPTAGAGARVTLLNGSAGYVTLKNGLAGGSGAQLKIYPGQADKYLPPTGRIELMYDGTTWTEVNRPAKELICSTSGAASTLASFDTNTVLGGNLPTVYKNLILQVEAQGDNAGSSVGHDLRINGDSAANYDYKYLVNGSSSGDNFGVTFIYLGDIPCNVSAGLNCNVEIRLPNYNMTSMYHLGQVFWSYQLGTSAGHMNAGYTYWRYTAGSAITRLATFPGAGNYKNWEISLWGES